MAPACPSPAAGAAQAGAALQCGFLSSITMEMVTNGAGPLTRFLCTHSPSSVERPWCSQHWARGCPCPSLCPKPLGTGAPDVPGHPDRVRAGWVCMSQGHPPPPCPQQGSCRGDADGTGSVVTSGDKGAPHAPPLSLTCHVTGAQPRTSSPNSHLSPSDLLAGGRMWVQGSRSGSKCTRGAEPCARAGAEGPQ